MIMRQWRGRVPREKEQEYLAYLHGTGLEEYRSTPGNLGVFVTTRPVGKAVEFLLVTFWDSEDAMNRSSSGVTPIRETIAQALGSSQPPTVELMEVAGEIQQRGRKAA